MREMVLNHASLAAPDRRIALKWLQDIATGMASLVQSGVTESSLTMRLHPYETPCLADGSLRDMYFALGKQGARDESLFLLRLSTKVPLLSEAEPDIEDRFRMCEALRCEAKTLPTEDGEPLVMCAITDGISVGFPSEPVWEQERITVTFDEMLSNGCIVEASEIIDNLTRSVHAQPILARFRAELRQLTSPAALWKARETAFLNLKFGPDVENHLAGLVRANLTTVVNKLAILDEAASQWREIGGPAPQWTCKVTDESASVFHNEKLREARRFRSYRGTRELFTWHARFGSGRIHLRIDANTREVEIGYVGPHLPL